MRYIVFILTALFISGGASVAIAQEETEQGDFEWSYSEWDANNDGMLDEQEFDAGYDEVGLYDELYDDWDVNGDGVLDEDEFGDGLYDSWDKDDNGYLEEDEAEEIGFWDW